MTDAPDDLDRLLYTWAADLAAALGVSELEIDRTLVLDVARDAAHGVARPAAPLTTFLVGYAAGLAAAHGTDPAQAVRAAGELAQALALNRGA